MIYAAFWSTSNKNGHTHTERLRFDDMCDFRIWAYQARKNGYVTNNLSFDTLVMVLEKTFEVNGNITTIDDVYTFQVGMCYELVSSIDSAHCSDKLKIVNITEHGIIFNWIRGYRESRYMSFQHARKQLIQSSSALHATSWVWSQTGQQYDQAKISSNK